MADDRFDDYQPAPLNQNGVERFARSSAGAAISGTKGVVLGYLGTALVVGLAVAALTILGGLGLGALVGPIFMGLTPAAGAIAALPPVLWGALGFGVVAAIASGPIAALGGLAGGLFGGFKGLTRESQRASVDQSFYDLSIVEATARGAAQGQAQAYIQTGMIPNAAINTQPPMRDSEINVEALLERRDNPKPKDTMVQTGTVINKETAKSEGASHITLSKADQVEAAARGQAHASL